LVCTFAIRASANKAADGKILDQVPAHKMRELGDLIGQPKFKIYHASQNTSTFATAGGSGPVPPSLLARAYRYKLSLWARWFLVFGFWMRFFAFSFQ
jgi:hypothetical protein